MTEFPAWASIGGILQIAGTLVLFGMQIANLAALSRQHEELKKQFQLMVEKFGDHTNDRTLHTNHPSLERRLERLEHAVWGRGHTDD